MLFAGETSGYWASWSARAEAEADRHLRPRMTRLAEIRRFAAQELSPTGFGAEKFTSTAQTDRQILADAAASGAWFLVTDDVDDFGHGDLAATGVSAVNPDLFLSERTTALGYAIALRVMAASMSNPPCTTLELHQRLGRQHPLTVAAHRSIYPIPALPATQPLPATLFRGSRCLRCLSADTPSAISPVGLCSKCAATAEAQRGSCH